MISERAEVTQPEAENVATIVTAEDDAPASEQSSGPIAEPADADLASDTAAAKRSMPRELTRRRASDAAILDIPWSEYERVLREVIRLKGLGTAADAASADNRDSGELDVMLAKWGINTEAWLTSLDQLDRSCTRMLGAAYRVLERARAIALQWVHGITLCRELFTGPVSDEFT